MWKYTALISYVGTDYCGWQKQKATVGGLKPSVQITIENALSKMTGAECKVVGSGRTDSGVHAMGQVIHFVLTQREWDSVILQRGLNGLLPSSIQVLEVQKVNLEFHAQRSATQKQYSYYFQQGPCAIPFLEPYSWWIRKPLNLGAMNQALSHLIGEHDFKPFQASGAKPGPTVRKILEAEAVFQPIQFPGNGFAAEFEAGRRVGLVRVRVLGTGFLKQMVRGIAGTLLQVGEGRRDPACFREIIESKNRLLVGPTAPARALWLERVWYPEEHKLGWLEP
jgi:tRNA pseudouridine38-40 synthase